MPHRGYPDDNRSICNRIIDRYTQQLIFQAALLAHAGNHRAAERTRERAGYGGLT